MGLFAKAIQYIQQWNRQCCYFVCGGEIINKNNSVPTILVNDNNAPSRCAMLMLIHLSQPKVLINNSGANLKSWRYHEPIVVPLSIPARASSSERRTKDITEIHLLRATDCLSVHTVDCNRHLRIYFVSRVQLFQNNEQNEVWVGYERKLHQLGTPQ